MDTTLMATNSLQVNTVWEQRCPALPPKVCSSPTTACRSEALSRPKLLFGRPSKRVSYTQELALIGEAHKLSRDWLPSKSKAQDGYPIKGKDNMIPVA